MRVTNRFPEDTKIETVEGSAPELNIRPDEHPFGPEFIFTPTLRGSMPTVDSKGRIVLPKTLRERLELDAGTEVEVRAEDDTLVVEPETNPNRVLDRMNRLVAETEPTSTDPAPAESTTPTDELDPIARKHRDAVRRGAEDDG